MRSPAVYFSIATTLTMALAAAPAMNNAWAQGHRASDVIAHHPRQKTFYILPHVEGLLLCDEALANPALTDIQQLIAYCVNRGLNASGPLTRLLDEMEPGGANGQVQLGYLLTMPLLDFFEKKQSGQWQIDEKRVQASLNLIRHVDRPVAVYFSSTHFDSTSPLAKELAANPENLMKLASGQPPRLGYFGYSIHPYTLRTDEGIPVNHYRFMALRHIAKKIAELPEYTREKIVGYTLAGEAHQLFPDFENGMGRYHDIQVTDYDPASVSAFRQWLQKKYRSIDEFNVQTGLFYDGFDAIDAPRKDIRKNKLNHFGEHFDAYADGTVPIAGWLWDPQQIIQRLDLYVDGQLIAPMTRYMNRLDVYRAKNEVGTPNTGFRHDLDFSEMSAGKHRIQVVAQTTDKRNYLVGERILVIVPRDQSAVAGSVPLGMDKLEGLWTGIWNYVPSFLRQWLQRRQWVEHGSPVSSIAHVQWWLDMPEGMLDVYYNPLARDWNEFRQTQVYAFLEKFHSLARAAGLPAAKLYSHQIVPRVNSSWNPQLFAVEKTLGGQLPWKAGFNLYGGAVSGSWLENFIRDYAIRDYAVPEFNPQQWKIPGIHLQAMRAQYKSDARFISPSFMSLVPKRLRSVAENDVNRMEIRPDNPAEGSSAFYSAIVEFARE